MSRQANTDDAVEMDRGLASDIAIVEALPKTRSGRILRKAMRAIADGTPEPVPATIDDASVLDRLHFRTPRGMKPIRLKPGSCP
ncbi:hypothetical protein [Saccharopolyspora sp. 5N708]|uniref:hypothetical protein n=1 Tax=Saccharopolyspora sp. 5N708 TaxID=3457424 RepID=UPI003FD1AB74